MWRRRRKSWRSAQQLEEASANLRALRQFIERDSTVADLRRRLAASRAEQVKAERALVAAEEALAAAEEALAERSRGLEAEHAEHAAALRQLEEERAKLAAVERALATGKDEPDARAHESNSEPEAVPDLVRGPVVESDEPQQRETSTREKPDGKASLEYLLFFPNADNYGILVLPGSAPASGSEFTLPEVCEDRFIVSKLGRSPLPLDTRLCAYLDRLTSAL